MNLFVPGLVGRRQLGQVGVDKTVLAQRYAGFSESDDFVHRPYGAALFKLDSLPRCDLTRVRGNYFHSAMTASESEMLQRRHDAFGGAGAAITVPKQRRIVRMAMDYLAHRGLLDAPCRFDVVAIDFEGGYPRIEVYTNAFTA